MKAPRFVAGAALLLALSSGACRRKAVAPPPRPALGEVSFRDLTPPGAGPAEVDPAVVAEAVRARLLATGLFAAAADAGGAGPKSVVRARGEFAVDGVVVEKRALARAVVRLRLDTRPSDAPNALEDDLQGQGEQTYDVPAHDAKAEAQAHAAQRALFTALVVRVTGDLINGLAAPRKLREASPEAVHAALVADGGELRQEAIRVAGQRQLKQEVPLLLELLNHPDEATRDAAMGALIAMKERRAVSELTKTRSLRDRREMRKLLEAVSILGGDEALEYLNFVSATHDDEEIRNEAVAAKQRLERRSGAAGHQQTK
jgi:hypothetical protein